MEKEQLYRYFNNQTSQEENIQIMEWVESSDENKKSFEEERLIWMALLMYSKPQVKKVAKPLSRRLCMASAVPQRQSRLLFLLYFR